MTTAIAASDPTALPRPDAIEPGQHVVIIGAGPAGLTAAYLLARQGVDVTVLEAGTRVGGISQTAERDGYRFDIGGHRFFTKIPAVQALWDTWLGEDLLEVPRLSRIHYRGRFFHYPLRAANALIGLGPIDALRILASYVRARLRPSLPEETFEQWVQNRFGRRLYEIFFRTYTEKVWGIPCSEIRAEWAAQRIQGLSLGRALLNATPLTRRDPSIKSLIDRFRYPRLGPGQMWEACRAHCEADGARVLLGHRAHRILVQDGRARAVVASTGDDEVMLPADHVISTTDLRALVRALGAAVPERTRTGAEGLRYRDFVLVALVIEGTDVFPDNWIYVHTPGVRVGRIQNFNNWSADLVPTAGRTCLGMEYFCFEGDELWAADDATLRATATREVAALGLVAADAVVDAFVVRMPKAYPIYDRDYRAHLAAVRAGLETLPNVHTIGRNGMHKYNNQDHSMVTAMLTVENLLHGASHDVWAVNTDFEYLEEQRLPTPLSVRVQQEVA